MAIFHRNYGGGCSRVFQAAVIAARAGDGTRRVELVMALRQKVQARARETSDGERLANIDAGFPDRLYALGRRPNI